MKRRIRYLFVLMCACILGIVALQGYWIYNSYRYNFYSFRYDATEALDNAVRHYIYQETGADGLLDSILSGAGPREAEAAETDSLFSKMRPAIRRRHNYVRLPAAGRKDSVVAEADSLFLKLRPAARRWYGRNRLPEMPRPAPDSTSPQLERLYRRLVSYWLAQQARPSSVDLPALDSLFADELREHNISAAFTLDTLHLIENDPHHIEWKDLEVEGFPITTRHQLLNPLNNLWVQAAFKTPLQYILGRMFWLLLMSLLLIGCTSFCFAYMLNTILKQKRISEIKNDFINNMTHELKTPITTVSAAVQAMQRFDALEDRQRTRSYLDMAEKQLDRLSDLVEKVLDVAVSEKKELVIHPEKVDLEELLEDVINAHKLNSVKPVSFQLYISLSNPFVYVDKTHLGNALNNLVDNAIKYSGERVDITIRCFRQQRNLVIRIKDNGIGIPRPYQEEVFEKFFRVPTGNLHNVKGFGLGLSYVKTVVEQHQGTISIQSEEGNGTEFILTLPQ